MTRVVSWVSMGSFLTTVVRESYSLVSRMSWDENDNFHAAIVRRSSHVAGITMQNLTVENVDRLDTSKAPLVIINGIAGITHAFIAAGTFPILAGFDGRPFHVARAADWVVLVPVMMILLHSYECRGRKKASKASVIPPMGWFSVFMQTVSVILGVLPSIFTMPSWCGWALLSISVAVYLNIYFLLVYMVRVTSSLSSVAPDTGGDVTPTKASIQQAVQTSAGLRDWLVARELHDHSAKSLLLCTSCAVLWTVIGIVRFAGIGHLISPQAELICLTCIEVLVKAHFTAIISDSDTHLNARQTALSALLDLERSATVHRRRFLRYVYVLSFPCC